jgi:hypothetical protein
MSPELVSLPMESLRYWNANFTLKSSGYVNVPKSEIQYMIVLLKYYNAWELFNNRLSWLKKMNTIFFIHWIYHVPKW